MKTWNDYKEHVKAADPVMAKKISETEEIIAIICALTDRRKALGLSQRDLAARCGLPQSSIGRMESGTTTPNLRTLLNVCRHLDLSISLTETRADAES